MKRRRGISENELLLIIKLKESGSSWLEIQEKSSVPRRSAKLAYERWQQSQSISELKAARVNVATELFKGHLEALVNMAGHVATKLTAPSSVQMSADRFLDSLLGQEIEGQSIYALPRTNARHRAKSVLANNRLLFKALQDHTKEKIRWESFDEWKAAWDKLIERFNAIKQNVSGFIETEFENYEEGLLRNIMIDSGNRKVIDCIVDTVIDTMICDIARNEFPSDEPIAEVVIDNRLFKIKTRVGDKIIFIFSNKELAEAVVSIFSSLSNSVMIMDRLMSPNDISGLKIRVDTTIQYLNEMLNPIALYPTLLSTRCDFCPV